MRINVNPFITDVKREKSNLEKKIYFYEKRPKRRWTKLSKFYVRITKAKKFFSGMIPKYRQSQLIKDPRTRITWRAGSIQENLGPGGPWIPVSDIRN